MTAPDAQLCSFEVELDDVEQPLNEAPISSQQQQLADGSQLDSTLDIANLTGYRSPPGKQFALLTLCTGGILLLVARWSLHVRLKCSLKRCPLGAAELVLITLTDGQAELVRPTTVLGQSQDELHAFATPGPNGAVSKGKPSSDSRFLEFRCMRLFWSEQRATYLPVPALPLNFREEVLEKAVLAQVQAVSTGEHSLLWAAPPDRSERCLWFGSNEMILPIKSMARMLLDELVLPFYIFQYASVLIWCLEEYYIYGFLILAITFASVVATVLNAHATCKRLAEMAHFTCTVRRASQGPRATPVSSTQLVPGDLVWVGAGVLACDLVLLRGECIVDENMLTGEAIPVRKVPYSPASNGLTYSPDTSKACTLYGGTNVAQVCPVGDDLGPLAMVARTRFNSAKGQLLQHMLYPRHHSTRYARDTLYFIAMMLTIGSILYIWSITALALEGMQPGDIVMRFLDLITIAVPPGLPACLQIALAVALHRLKTRREIFASDPHVIPTAGQLDTVCFDKTGTLTESGLELKGVVLVRADRLGFDALLPSRAPLPPGAAQLLATCHGLAQLDGHLVGDPLDQLMLEASGWSLQEAPSTKGGQVCARVQPPGSTHCWDILRRFEFSAEQQRSVVVAQAPSQAGFWVHAKGSPEAIQRLVHPASIPPDYDALLGSYTSRGLRVIAIAAWQLDSGVDVAAVHAMSQSDLERGLALIGLVVLDNPLKPDSREVVLELQAASLRVIMVTGDAARTAISVAQQCNILPPTRCCCLVDASEETGAGGRLELLSVPPHGTPRCISLPDLLRSVAEGDADCAVTGRGFQGVLLHEDPAALQVLLQHAGVWARMAPADKARLVHLLGDGGEPQQGLEGLGHWVAFCGDGANDVGALKAAHVGVSLCEAEASVAAPLTSRQQSTACMLHVIQEGRASLTTSHAIFKFIIVYAVAQILTVSFVYSYGLIVASYQYLIQDLFYTSVLAGLMALTAPRSALAPAAPRATRLMSPQLLLPVGLQLVGVLLFQGLGLAMLRKQAWYVKHEVEGRAFQTSYAPENTVIFLVCTAQFVITAFVFHKGRPHRLPLWTNRWLVGAMVVQSILWLYLTLSPGDAFTHGFAGLVPLPSSLRWGICLLVLGNLLVAILLDQAAQWLLRCGRRWQPRLPGSSRKAYERAA
ncbi:hypothetical protein WJX72_009770 [[Myrmecia] bisecta]|uniref:Cation-transporting ATPase n=1 Tax=[Myrmecia] bisecta TaxID=41462 RepID=A0AAW1PPN5_9CHLO